MNSRPSISRRSALAWLPFSAAIGTIQALDRKEHAPNFTAVTMDGEKFNNQSVKGKVVLIQFWATWCQYCKRDQPAVDAVMKQFAAQGLVVLAVDVGESKKKVKQYLDASPRACRIVLTENTNLAALYAAKSFPLYVLIDKDGNVAATQNGSGGEEALRDMLEKAGLKSE